MVGVLPDMLSKGIGFTVTAVWWLLVTIPLIRGFKQRNYVETEGHDIRKAFAKIFHTLKNIATHDKKVLFFLIAFFLYIDGVGTIIDNAINIGTDLNLNTVGQVVFLLATQVVAFGGSLVFAKLSKKYNTVTLILVCIAGYFGIALYALMLSSLLHFAILAFFIGCFQGSIQSLSRSYYSKIIPAPSIRAKIIPAEKRAHAQARGLMHFAAPFWRSSSGCFIAGLHPGLYTVALALGVQISLSKKSKNHQ